MSPPAAGASDGTFEFSLRTPITSQNDPWRTGYRVGLTAGVFNVSFEQGLFGGERAIMHHGVNLGIGGPLQKPPIWKGFSWFGRLDYFALRWREERTIPYSGIEFGIDRRLNKNWAWFVSITGEYPGLLMVPAVLLSNVRDDIRNRDSFVTMLNVGILFDRDGPYGSLPE